METLILIFVAIALPVVALLTGRFLGISNARCYSSESNQAQGRLRLDDCKDYECHAKGCCKYFSSLPKE